MIDGTMKVSIQNDGVVLLIGVIVMVDLPRTGVEEVLANVVMFMDECCLRSINAHADFSVMKLA